MKGNDYSVYLGEILIGIAWDVGDDMPNTGGNFEPTEAFEPLKDLFETEYSLIRGPSAEWHRVRKQSFSLGVRLELLTSQRVIEAEAEKSPGKEFQGILAYLHIHDGKIWWRLM